jgi:hypothetical protein
VVFLDREWCDRRIVRDLHRELGSLLFLFVVKPLQNGTSVAKGADAVVAVLQHGVIVESELLEPRDIDVADHVSIVMNDVVQILRRQRAEPAARSALAKGTLLAHAQPIVSRHTAPSECRAHGRDPRA